MQASTTHSVEFRIAVLYALALLCCFATVTTCMQNHLSHQVSSTHLKTT